MKPIGSSQRTARPVPLHAALQPAAAAPQRAATEDRYQVPALQRGLQLLGQFSRDEPALSGAELSRRLDLPRASVFRILQTLEQLGFVERVGESAQYRLGIAVLRLGFEYLASMELTELGRPIIDELCNTTGFSAHLVVRDGRDVVFVAKAVGRSFLVNSIQVGARLPAHATVLGRVLLAGLTLDELAALYVGRELAAYTEQTPTTVADLKRMVDDDARRGHGISLGGFESAISTIAAPVFDDQHRVHAAVSVTVPSQQVEPALKPFAGVSQERMSALGGPGAAWVGGASLDELVAQVRSAAQRLSQRFSHPPAAGKRIDQHPLHRKTLA